MTARISSPSKFVTSHGLILMHLSEKPSLTQRELSDLTDLTQRRVQEISNDLERDGYITKIRDGRQNVHKISPLAKKVAFEVRGLMDMQSRT